MSFDLKKPPTKAASKTPFVEFKSTDEEDEVPPQM